MLAQTSSTSKLIGQSWSRPKIWNQQSMKNKYILSKNFIYKELSNYYFMTTHLHTYRKQYLWELLEQEWEELYSSSWPLAAYGFAQKNSFNLNKMDCVLPEQIALLYNMWNTQRRWGGLSKSDTKFFFLKEKSDTKLVKSLLKIIRLLLLNTYYSIHSKISIL